MDVINLPSPLNLQVNTDVIVGIQNYLPTNTFRYNINKRQHIESILGDISQYIVNLDSVVMNDPNIDIQ